MKNSVNQKLLLAPTLSFFSANFANAGLFRITDRSYGTTDTAKIALYDSLLNQLESEVNANLPSADATTYLKAIANSTVTSGTGIGVDYHSPFKLFVAGIQAGAGADLGPGNSTKDLIKGDVDADRIRGFGAQGALMAGLNLSFLPTFSVGPISSDRLKAFAHIFSYKKTISEVSIKTMSIGGHLQYKLIDKMDEGFGLARWHGIDVTTGFRYTKLDTGISKTVTENLTSTLAAPVSTSVTAAFSGTAAVSAKSKAFTIPLEVSTAGRLLYLLGAFGGLGTDISFGKAEGSASATGNVSVTGVAPGDSVSGTGSISLGQKKGPRIMDFKYFVGPFIELGVLPIYAQYAQGLLSDTIGVNAGIKAFW